MSKPRKSDTKDTSISSKLLGVNVSDINIEKFRDINAKREKYALKGNLSVPILKSVSNKFSPLVIFAITLPGQGIASVEALTECINLMVVNLSQNLIDSLTPLKGLTEIKVADFSQNNLSNVDGLNSCANLVNIHLEGNKIKSVDALRALKNIQTLKSIHLQTLSGDLQNPICAQGSYRIAILDNFERLRRLDCNNSHLI